MAEPINIHQAKTHFSRLVERVEAGEVAQLWLPGRTPEITDPLLALLMAFVLRGVEAGEEIVIARDGHPVARLVPLRPRKQSREPGIWRGLVRLAPDFDEPDEALLDSFEQ